MDFSLFDFPSNLNTWSDFPSSSPTSSSTSSSTHSGDRDATGFSFCVGEGEGGELGGKGGGDLDGGRFQGEVDMGWNAGSAFKSTSPTASLPYLLDPRTILIPSADTIPLNPSLLHSPDSSSSSTSHRTSTSTSRRVESGTFGEGMDDEEVKERNKKDRRKETNRMSARSFRERKRKEQNQLEKVLERRDHEIEVLRKEAEKLRTENLGLRGKEGGGGE
ncbi:hypothetical protein BDY24DRAFT_227318 [Mrakia frigida]|uniref:uncharacterized protein n=1 Tax=Mrakia frigida TaxID=29902 RepID=UPI003FCC0048